MKNIVCNQLTDPKLSSYLAKYKFQHLIRYKIYRLAIKKDTQNLILFNKDT